MKIEVLMDHGFTDWIIENVFRQIMLDVDLIWKEFYNACAKQQF